jgi:hypothetical protein
MWSWLRVWSIIMRTNMGSGLKRRTVLSLMQTAGGTYSEKFNFKDDEVQKARLSRFHWIDCLGIKVY